MKFTIFQKVLSVILLFGLLILIAGCPYSSTVPIDEGTSRVPAGLEGQWIKVSDKESENPPYIEIKQDDKTNATALKYEFSSENSVYEATTYHLTFSDVTGDIFMNVIEEGGSSYSLFKFIYDEKAVEITTYEVTDYIKESFNTSAELKSFVAKNKEIGYFYTNTVDTYVRK